VLAAALAGAGVAQAQLGGVIGTVTDTTDTVTGTVGGILPGGGSAGTQAAGITAVIGGVVTTLASSGTVSDPSQPVGTGQALASIPGVLSAEALHSAAMAWTDQAASQASLSNLALTVAGTGITAAFLGSEALAGATRTGASAIEGLRIGGVPVSASGAPNQAVSVPGLSVILNEQTQTANGIVVNALRVRSLDGLTDVALGTSRAGI
jgi:hypothetical protein